MSASPNDGRGRMNRAAVLLAVALLLARPGAAEWQPTGGPPGGPVSALGAGRLLLAGTPNGVYVNDGTWRAASMPEAGLDIRSFAGTGDTVLAAYSGGVLRSSDGGERWHNTGAPMMVRSIVRHGGAILAGTADGILRSTDEGMTWAPSSAGLLNQDVHALLAVGSRVWAGTGDGTFYSDDGGATWSPRRQGLPAGPVNCLAASRSRVVAGTAAGIYMLNDPDASTWWLLFFGPSGSVSALVAEGSFIAAGTEHGVSVSTNSGWTWSSAQAGLPDPRILSLAQTADRLWAGTANGLAVSTDGGRNWTPEPAAITASTVTALVTDDDLVLAAMAGGPVGRSDDGGQTWQVHGGPGAETADLLWEGSHLLGATSRGVKTSADGGATWEQRGTGLDAVQVLGLARAAGSLVAGTTNGVYVLDDGADQWIQKSFGLAGASVTALAVSGDGWVAGTRAAGLYRTGNRGETWQPVAPQLAGIRVHALVTAGSGLLLAATSAGVHRSTDGGTLWEQAGLAETAVYDLCPLGSSVFAACGDAGLYRSPLRESRWEPVAGGGADIRSLDATATRLLAGTNGQAVLAADLPPILPGAPVIASIPLRARSGEDISILGSGFSSGARVFFGSVEGEVSSASAGTVTAAVPRSAPAAPVSLVVDGLSGRSARVFSPLFESSRIIDSATFGQPRRVVEHSAPVAAPADLDGDGRLDLVGSDGTQSILYRNTGAPGKQGTFLPAAGFGQGHDVAVIVDLDADGDQDVIAARRDTLLLYRMARETDSVKLATTGLIALGEDIGALCALDVDGDGALDIVAAHPATGAVTVSRNRNRPAAVAGEFSRPQTVAAVRGAHALTAGDLDGDGTLDLVVAGTDEVAALFNRSTFGAPAFVQGTVVGIWEDVAGVLAEDLDSDGSTDLAVARGAEIVVMVNASVPGTFAAEATLLIPSADASGTLTCADLDGDGLLDLIASPSSGGRLSVIRNLTAETGGFAVPVDRFLAGSDGRVWTADLDGDDRPDLILGDGGGISVCANMIGPAPEPAFAVSPEALALAAMAGETVRETLLVANPGQILLKVDSITTSGSMLAVDPVDLKVVPGNAAPVVVSFMAGGPGQVSDVLVFHHTAPGSPDSVLVTASVEGKPVLVIETPSLEFGEAPVGATVWDSIGLVNAGSAALRIDSVRADRPEFVVGSPPSDLPSGQAVRIPVGYAPAAPGPIEGGITLWHSAAGSPARVAVRGTGLAFASWSLRPDSIGIAGVGPGEDTLVTATITNAGLAALTVDSVVCSVDGFQILPSAMVVGPGDSATVSVRFAPVRTGIAAGWALFYHSAPGAPARLGLLADVPGVPSFSVAKSGLAFGTIPLGQTGLDSVLVSNQGTAPLLVDSAVTSAPEFTVSPRQTFVQPGAALWFVVRYSPGSDGSHSGLLTFWHNASHEPVSVALSGSAIAPPPAPVLVQPLSGKGGLTSTVELSWNPSPGANAYRLELATDPSMSHPVLLETLADTSRIIERLAYNTTFSWRVSAHNDAGWGAWCETAVFRTASTVALSAVLSYPADPPAPSAYRLVGIPGTDALTVSRILEGNQRTDWRLYRDNGASSDYLVELSGSVPLSIGEGYWMLRRGDFALARSLTMPVLEPDGTTAIPLHPGPNIIANPFDRAVAWRELLASNAGLAGEVPLAFTEGSYVEAASLEPFQGYYIRNYANLPRLKIPYPFHAAPLARQPAGGAGWRIALTFEGDSNADRGVTVGVADGARTGRDDRDRWKPGPMLGLCHLAVVRRDLDEAFPFLGADIRSAGGEGHVWSLELRDPRHAGGTLVAEGVDGVPEGHSVFLVDLRHTVPVDLRSTPRLELPPGSDRAALRVLVGPPEFVSDELARLVPERLALLQNYPNPFNPVTSIPFTLPRAALVRLDVVSLVGQTVATLVDGPLPAGVHTLRWDGTDGRGAQVSSGVYFYRLVADQSVVGTRKLVLLK